MIVHEFAPWDFGRWNKALQGAYNKGAAAFKEGEPLEACPYEDKRTGGGQITWSRGFRTAWVDGFVAARTDDKRRNDAITDFYEGKLSFRGRR